MNKINKGVIGAAIIACCSACTDTIDEHYNVSEGTSTQTLWQQLQNQSDLTDFVKILEKTHYYKNDTEASGMTYKDLLNSNTKLTVWAPKNGTYDAASLLAQLENNGERDVEKRFIRNHINVFSKSISSDVENDSITMLNGKMCILDKEKMTLKGIAIGHTDEGYQIGASNGLLYKLEDEIPFLNNIYEYLSITPDVSSFYGYLHTGDTTYFDENNSVKGPVVDGEVQIVDSAFITYNRLFSFSSQLNGNTWNGLNADLRNEDSTFVMIAPKDQAWTKAVQNAQKHFNYMSYPYANKHNVDLDPVTINPDSMSVFQINQTLANRLVFNLNQQKDVTIDNITRADSLISTRREIFRKPLCQQIFDGKTPVAVSNGYVYMVDNYLFPTMDSIAIEAENSYLAYPEETKKTRIEYKSIPKGRRNPKYGHVSGDTYVRTTYIPGGRDFDKNQLSYKLPDILSGKYDIYAIFLPQNIQDTTMTALSPVKFQATLQYYDGSSKSEKKTSVKMGDKEETGYPIATEKIDTVLLFKDFEFKVAYKGVPNAYPILTIESNASRSEVQNKKFTNSMCLDKIILRPKE